MSVTTATRTARSVPVLGSLRGHIARRAAHRELQRSLAVYASYAGQSELAAVLDRSTPEDAAEIRAVLHRMGIAA
ncbi:hypothetical protein CLV92_110155 [Kineococcus xinjiangensis]|uniref:Uncharacterized protein n=1 Tax=Kineococcus xinjiangensis TaxID=512762 RepID=A0A2S6IH53_9ACTN|nr:hypothetical protein [Kineococcus xinjiangensis]PPK93527.1 hypothetical protein CLV92_110155 [Kineococcus xinjiangensis]